MHCIQQVGLGQHMQNRQPTKVHKELYANGKKSNGANRKAFCVLWHVGIWPWLVLARRSMIDKV
jgi:hypothetical protein